jgi:hypothetical protein
MPVVHWASSLSPPGVMGFQPVNTHENPGQFDRQDACRTMGFQPVVLTLTGALPPLTMGVIHRYVGEEFQIAPGVS